MNLKILQDTLNNNDTHHIGCLATQDDEYIGYFCSKGDTCIGHCLESTRPLAKHLGNISLDTSR